MKTSNALDQKVVPLSHSQLNLWVACQLDSDAGAYSGVWAVRIREKVDVGALESALSAMVNRHEPLRTSFREIDGVPYQTVSSSIRVTMPLVILDELRETEREAAAERTVETLNREPFNLYATPPWRFVLLRLDQDDYVFALSVHHLLADGASFGIFAQEFESLYRKFQNQTEPFDELPGSGHTDFVRANGTRVSNARDSQLAYWREQLTSSPLAAPIGWTVPGSTPKVCKPSRLFVAADVMEALRKIARQTNSTSFTVFFAVLALLIYRLTGQADMLIGMAVSGRHDPASKGLIGCFVNTLPVRVRIGPDISFITFMSSVRKSILGALGNQDVPFYELVNATRQDQALGSEPLLRVLLTHQVASPSSVDRSAQTWEGFGTFNGMSKFDLTLSIVESNVTKLAFEPGRDLWDDEGLALFSRRFVRLLSSIPENVNLPIDRLAIIDEVESRQLAQWNATARAYPNESCLQTLIEQQVERTPYAVAVSFNEETLTYLELNRRANRLAHYLRQIGIGPDDRVGLCAERSCECLPAFLGIMKAGAAYVPLEPEHPIDRLSYMLADADVRALIIEAQFLDRITDYSGPVLLLDDLFEEVEAESDENPELAGGPKNLIYVIYTSGSTGRPKGVMLEHRAVVNRLNWMQETYPLSNRDRVLQKTSFGFDVSVWELFWPLLAGAEVVMARPQGHRDSTYLVETIRERGITTIHFVPSMLDVFLGEPDVARCVSLRQVFCSGEALSVASVRQFQGVLSAGLYNLYGPTEAAVDVSHWRCEITDNLATVPIGKPISNLQLFVLDRYGEVLPPGCVGDLYIGGVGLGRGYIQNPALTADRFVPHPFASGPGERLYRTGDLARWTPLGDIEFCGRSDFQVKVRGFRIELGEIESALRELDDIRQAIVVVRQQPQTQGDKLLVAYVVTDEGAGSTSEWKRLLRERLPEYMIPSFIVPMKEFPLTTSGKVDRFALPSVFTPEETRPDSGTLLGVEENVHIEHHIADIWKELLGLPEVQPNERFFDLGGNSLLLMRVRSRIQDGLGLDVSVMDLFRYVTVRSLASHVATLAPNGTMDVSRSKSTNNLSQQLPLESNSRDAVAIISLGGRFPGAPSLDGYWRNLRDGVECVEFLDDNDLLQSGVPAELIRNPNYVKAYRPLKDCDLFDASFFEFTPKEAEITDPQHRIFIECCWEALEDAGYDPHSVSARIGVFAAQGSTSYLSQYVQNQVDSKDAGKSFHATLSNEKDHLPMRVSYKLNLKGPSVAVQTACSSSLVAVHMACQSLLNSDCDMVLAGGVRISLPQERGYLYQSGGIASPDGHCRAFDAQAAGTVGGNGAGVVLLKRLSEAQRDGDNIRAIILGSAINNDGAEKIGYTAPSIEGQASVIRQALANSGVTPNSIGYVEAHGTGTPLGDPIEVKALIEAFGDSGRNYCGLGSVKTNIGHLDAAAGVAGLIKTVLALENEEIPPSLHYQQPNPTIDFKASPFFVVDQLRPWPKGKHVRRAGVSSFGMGGTNAHVVLEEAPPRSKHVEQIREWHVLPIAARSTATLGQLSLRMADHIENHPELELADVAHTLQVGRRHFAYRKAIVCNSASNARLSFESITSGWTGEMQSKPRVAFLFPGQGAQRVGMGQFLYRTETVFRTSIDQCAEILRPGLGIDLRRLLYPNDSASHSSEHISETWLTQPALFALEYSLAQHWMHWGIRPAAVLGHSLGEYVAACIAGVMSLEDALSMVTVRGRLMHDTARGAMIAVPLGSEEAQRILLPGTELAAINTKGQSVVSGDEAAIAELERILRNKGIESTKVSNRYAFHSSLMDRPVERLEEEARKYSLRDPRLPLLSNLSGSWVQPGEMLQPHYWSQHLRRPVRFADQLQALAQQGNWTLLEVGAGKALTSMVRRELPGCSALSSLGNAQDGEEQNLMETLAQLWVIGASIKWDAVARPGLQRISLPTYPLERKRYWIGSLDSTPSIGSSSQPANSLQWTFRPAWRRSESLPRSVELLADASCNIWIVCTDQNKVADGIVSSLRQRGHHVIVLPYSGSPAKSNAQFPHSGIAELLKPLSQEKHSLVNVAILSDLSEATEQIQDESLEHLTARYSRFNSLIQALGEYASDSNVRLTIVASGSENVSGSELVTPYKVMLQALALVASQEYPRLLCRTVDISPFTDGDTTALRWLLDELELFPPEPRVALRRAARWQYDVIPKVAENGSRRIHEGGTYLITGGLGKIGREIALYLAHSVRARLVLIGRNPVGTEEFVNELESLGATVLILKADVSSEDDMRRIISTTFKHFGTLNGVFHAAGVTTSNAFMPIARTDPSIIELHFKSKAAGTIVLDRVLADLELDFCILFSSISAIVGGMGYSTYAAANAFMDAFAAKKCTQGPTPWLSINWDAWSFSTSSWDGAAHPFGAKSLTTKEGIAILDQLLNGDLPEQVIVSPNPTVSRLPRAYKRHTRTTSSAAVDLKPSDLSASPRPDGPSLREEFEPEIGLMWEALLGYSGLGPEANFFSLGGDSILSLQLASRLAEIGIVVTPRQILENPTIRDLARIAREQKQTSASLVLYPQPATTETPVGPLFPLANLTSEQLENLTLHDD